MGKIYLILCLFFLFSSNSQTLTQTFNEPLIGDIDISYRIDTSNYLSGLPVTVTGSNCVWNFSNLKGAFPLVTDSFISPTGAPGTTMYPGATYVQHRDLLYSYFKSTTSPAQTELLGGYSTTLSLTFTNSAIIATYPISYGYLQSDPVSGSFKYNTSTGACNGSVTISADGIGTLNFPNGVNITNVLRLKSVETLTLSSGILPVGSFNQIVYNYYKPGAKYPILNINYTIYSLLAQTPTITALIYGNRSYFTVEGIQREDINSESLDIYPNPFKDKLNFNPNITISDNEYLVFDSTGQLVVQTKSLIDESLENLKSGIYFLTVKNKDGLFRKKIIKE